MRAERLVLDHNRGDQPFDLALVERRPAGLGPGLLGRLAPAGAAGFHRGLAGGVDLDPVDLDIAGAGDRSDPAIPLDLRDQLRRTDRERDDPQRKRDSASQLGGRSGAPVAQE